MPEAVNECGYIAYIDESGELGYSYDRGSSEFLVMGAVIVPAWMPNLAVELFEHAHEVHSKQPKPFPKFQNCNERNKHILTSLMANYPIWTVHIAGYKPALSNTSLGLNKTRLYAYLIKFTLERISWFVRDQDHCHAPARRCHLVFSRSDNLPYQSIKDYLSMLRHGNENYNCRIDWRYISESDFETKPHVAESELHLADIAAGALYHAIDPTKKKFGLTDDRFIRNLRHSICRNEKQVYGLKLFPKETSSLLESRNNLDFYRAITNRSPA